LNYNILKISIEAVVPIVRLRIVLKALKRRKSMGKVINVELPEDHPIFKAGWSLSSLKKITKKRRKQAKKPINSNLKEK